jgi:methylmalonyl-CoA mutase cobalamin-binding subunit
MTNAKSTVEKALRAAAPSDVAAVAVSSIRTPGQLRDACRELEAQAGRLGRQKGELILVAIRVG